ncbi:hypothetical protein ID866_3515 [Astraeus odoratus]|nr:hypothetical protein ID866_3515 [Astraeus odoratus]
MTARPPPTRPHIALYSSFDARANADWGEDDVWDSASDSESPRQSTIAHSWRPTTVQAKPQSSPSTAPKPVPRASSNSSSSTLALSYTHVNAPSPSSYPPKTESLGQSSKGGWTMVRKPSVSQGSTDGKLLVSYGGVHDDADLDSDMVVGDLEPEIDPVVGTKARLPQGSMKADAEGVVNGTNMTSFSPRLSKHSVRSLPWASLFSAGTTKPAI